jgi:type IV secretory pathway VirB6-like protein
MQKFLIYFAIIMTFFTANVRADNWASEGVDALLGRSFCLYSAPSHPSLTARLATLNLPLTTSSGWFSSDASVYQNKAIMLNWTLNNTSSGKYKMMYAAYGTGQSLYIAQRGADGKYKWLGNVPGQTSPTANGFSTTYQYTMPVDFGKVMQMKLIPRTTFLADSANTNWNTTNLTPYSGTDPSIGNGFMGSGFDNKLVKRQHRPCAVTLNGTTGVDFTPSISNNILHLERYMGTGVYEGTVKFDVIKKSTISSFKLIYGEADDHLLLKINGQTVYWLGHYGNNNAPAKNSAPNSSLIVSDLRDNLNSTMDYLGPTGTSLDARNHEDGTIYQDTISNPVDLKDYLRDGENELYIKLIVFGGGQIKADFQFAQNCAAISPILNPPANVSFPDCTLSNIPGSPDCILSHGAGVAIKSDSSINNKTEAQSFVTYGINDIFQFEPSANGNLSINYPNLSSTDFGLYGNYFFDVDIGIIGNIANNSTPRLIYKICPTTTYCTNAPEVTVSDKNYKADAYATGKLFMKIVDPNFPTLSGVGQVKIQSYNGTTQYSDFIYDNVIYKMQTKLMDASRVLYQNAIINASTKKIYASLMTLYIMLYGIYFFLGMVQIKLHDLVGRIIKIVILSQVFSATSWDFFNKYFFNIFTGGMSYLMFSVSGLTSSTDNLFGFIDPFMEKLSNDQFWAALAAQIASIHNGLTVIGILVLMGVFSFLIGAFEIILTYLIAVMSLSVMICMAPLFMVMVLFSKTKPLFDNWVSMLFSNAIQPTITLLLFLVVDQLFETYVSRSVLRACVGVYIPINLYLDFSWIHDGWNVTIPLPFFPGIPFLIPSGNATPDLLTSAILTYIFGKVSLHLSDFSISITAALSSVQSGAGQMAQSVKNDAMGQKV